MAWEAGPPAAPTPEDSQGLEAAAEVPSTGAESTDRDSRRDKHDAELDRLCALWPTLPAHARVGLLAMAAAAAERPRSTARTTNSADTYR